MGKKPKYPKYPAKPNRVESSTVDALDRLTEFEEFERSILPAIRSDIAAGLSADSIYKKYQSLAAARTVTIAATEVDAGKALTAIKDILDRAGGKATEKKEVTHRLANLPREELDAYLLTKLKERGQLLEGTESDEECEESADD